MNPSRCGHIPPVPRCLLCFRAGLTGRWEPDNPHVPEQRGRPGGDSPAGPCRHLAAGDPFTLRECPTCAGRVRLKEYPCRRGLGVGGRAVPSVDCGVACPAYDPQSGG